MSDPIDILALTLLALTALIAIFLRFRFPEENAAASEEEEVLYRQKQYDPSRMKPPLTGLGDDASFIGGAGYLPAGVQRLLFAQRDEGRGDVEAMALADIMRPGPKEIDDRATVRLIWTISAFVILLGLFFLLLWMLNIHLTAPRL